MLYPSFLLYSLFAHFFMPRTPLVKLAPTEAVCLLLQRQERMEEFVCACVHLSESIYAGDAWYVSAHCPPSLVILMSE